jgi:hypothetical protein
VQFCYNEYMASLSALTDPEIAIIFETSPLGLGHLRVTDALYHGLPKNASPILFGTQAPRSSALYRFASVHRSTRTVLEMLQLPPLDKPVAAIGRKILRHQTKDVYESLKRILSERFTVPQTVLFVATHAIHAHPLGAIKQRLMKEMGIQVLLVVQITDDSPQAIWYVPDADIIFAPSEYTKQKLVEYAKKAHLPYVRIVVAAYPISPLLTQELTDHMLSNKKEQLDPKSEATIQVSIPVSGAAVGTDAMITYMKDLHQHSGRYNFQVVVREAPFTMPFIQEMTELPYVKLTVSQHERTTIDNYEKVFREHTIALEFTKPSEQTFKVLAKTSQRGGSIMLFTHPVGGQEYDNVRFLHTHGLVPTENESAMLWEKAEKGEHLQNSELLQKAEHWRGVMLPEHPQQAATFTHWCLQEKIFAHMFRFDHAGKRAEVQPNGVEQFWIEIAKLIERRTKLL